LPYAGGLAAVLAGEPPYGGWLLMYTADVRHDAVGQSPRLTLAVAVPDAAGHNLVSSALHLSPVPVGAAGRYVHLLGGLCTGGLIAVCTHGRQYMNTISKTVVGALVIASLIGGSAAVAVVSAETPVSAVHPIPQAATAIEYGL
jgi:hypothetical protein